MSASNAEKLEAILRRLNSGEDPSAVKAEAHELLGSLSARDLSEAEQRLVDAGLDPQELRDLCAVHLEMMRDQLEDLKASLPPGHVVHTLMREHEYILEFLDELERINRTVQELEAYEPDREEWTRLKHIAQHLVEAEPHHQREEDVLFPKLEALGVTGPPRIMRMEHVDLRHHKHELQDLSRNVADMDFATFKKELKRVANFLVFHLRDHIFKEDSILYPTAVDLIKDESVWEQMHDQADRIGYCCFTPDEERSSGGNGDRGSQDA